MPIIVGATFCFRTAEAVAKLDRLARNVAFTSALLESSVKFMARLGYEPAGYDSANKALEAIGHDSERFDEV